MPRSPAGVAGSRVLRRQQVSDTARVALVGEHEDRAARLSVWCPGTVHGLFQTEAYARVLLSTLSSVPGEVTATRLANRIARQQRVLFREDPPSVSCIVDQVALYRGEGSRHHGRADASLARCGQPSQRHDAGASGCRPSRYRSELIIADDNAAYAEHLAAGGVYTESERLPVSSWSSLRFVPSATALPTVRQSSGRRKTYGLAQVVIQRPERVVRRDSQQQRRCPGARYHQPRRRDAQLRR